MSRLHTEKSGGSLADGATADETVWYAAAMIGGAPDSPTPLLDGITGP